MSFSVHSTIVATAPVEESESESDSDDLDLEVEGQTNVVKPKVVKPKSVKKDPPAQSGFSVHMTGDIEDQY